MSDGKISAAAHEIRVKHAGAPPSANPKEATPAERARSLRRNAGVAERKFWSRVRAHRLAGYKFRRQVPLGPFIADFVCAAARLVIEIDGDQHAEAAAYDAARTRYLERLGYRVLRFPTHDVLHRIDNVLDALRVAVEERLIERRATSPGVDAVPSPPIRGKAANGPLLSREAGEES